MADVTPTTLPENVTAGGTGHVTHTNQIHEAVNALTGSDSSAQMVVRYNSGTSTWPARPTGAGFGVVWLSTNSSTAAAPPSGSLLTGDIWRKHPDAT